MVAAKDSKFLKSMQKWFREEEIGLIFTDPFSSLNGAIKDLVFDSEKEEVKARNETFRYLVLSYMNELYHDIGFAAELCESPIEELVLYSLIVAGKNKLLNVRVIGPVLHFYFGPETTKHLSIKPQEQIGEFRVDFLLELDECTFGHEPKYETAKAKLIVECDGHEFHEKTKEQAKRDKGRDRILQSCGFPVFRFTGAEIWADAFNCANSILAFLIKNQEEARKEIIKRREASR